MQQTLNQPIAISLCVIKPEEWDYSTQVAPDLSQSSRVPLLTPEYLGSPSGKRWKNAPRSKKICNIVKHGCPIYEKEIVSKTAVTQKAILSC